MMKRGVVRAVRLGASLVAVFVPQVPLPARPISPTPTLLLSSPPATDFTRIAGAVRLPSGALVVADGGSNELRLFSPTGAFVKALSRTGEGPGEFRGSMTLERSGDTLFVLESFPGPSQLHAFTAEQGFLTRTLLRASNSTTGVAGFGRLATGEILVQPGRGFRPLVPGTPGTLTRDSLRLGLLRLEEGGGAPAGPAAESRANPGTVTWLGTFPATSFHWYENPSVAARVVAVTYTLGPTLVFGTSADRVWIGDSGTGTITLFARDGTRVGEATMPTPARPFDAAALERARARALAAATRASDTLRIEALYGRAHRPRTTPRFSRFVPGPDGEMWVELFAEDQASAARFVVFDRTGRAVATVAMPAGVGLTEAGRDYVVGVRTDADGVEEVGVWGVAR